MAEEGKKITTHAETKFDPEEYLQIYDAQFTGKRDEDVLRKFMMNQLHEIYKDGTITGDRLLDLGTGPCCYSVFAASKWFREIVLSDLWEPNVSVLRDWKAGKRQDQEHLFKYMLELEGSQEDWLDRSRALAEKVGSVVRADMCSEDMLKGTDADGLQFDAISTILSQSVASPTPAGHKQVIANYSRLLKTGGHLVVLDCIDVPFYQVGETRFKVMNIPCEQFRSAIEESGYDTVYWKTQPCYYDADTKCTFFAMVAKKK